MIEVIANALKLREASENLRKIKENSSSGDFSKLVKDFEVEVDMLNESLLETFGDCPDVTQIVYELKSAVVALRDGNVESDTSIS